jgi:hypothetical protein
MLSENIMHDCMKRLLRDVKVFKGREGQRDRGREGEWRERGREGEWRERGRVEGERESGGREGEWRERDLDAKELDASWFSLGLSLKFGLATGTFRDLDVVCCVCVCVFTHTHKTHTGTHYSCTCIQVTCVYSFAHGI